MKAAVVTDFTQPLELQDRPIPEPGPGQVLVRMETCGLCHTDIHAAHGDWPVKPTPPFVPGHEGVGIVEQVGDGVTARGAGDRVAIAWLGHACGHCDHCVSQLFDLNEDVERFKELGAQIVALSPDAADVTRERYKQYGPFKFPVLADRVNGHDMVMPELGGGGGVGEQSPNV